MEPIRPIERDLFPPVQRVERRSAEEEAEREREEERRRRREGERPPAESGTPARPAPPAQDHDDDEGRPTIDVRV